MQPLPPPPRDYLAAIGALGGSARTDRKLAACRRNARRSRCRLSLPTAQLAALPPHLRAIVRFRLRGLTLASIGQRLGLSRARVWQLQRQALEILQKTA